jgi:signal transduction histidine kinase
MKKIPHSLKVVIAIILNIIIGLIDWKSGNKMPFTIFFMLPIYLLATQKESTKVILFANSLFAALIWVIVYGQNNHLAYSILNGILRFAMFLFVSLVIKQLVVQKAQLAEQNEKLRKLNEELKILNGEKNKILGIAAHDIRNGIGAIYSFSGLLYKDEILKLNLKRKFEFIEIIHKSSENLLALLGNILDISKIEAGIITIKLKYQDYINFIKERIDLFKYIAQKKEITIDADFKINNLTFEFDAIYMIEVIDNLLSNAIKYSYPNNEIKISVYQKDSFVITEVTDFGVGIPEEEISEIFKPFKKSSSQPTSGEPSTGLGLAIVMKIVELHKGTVGVNSIINEGSTFYFSLPLHQNII